MGKKSKPPLSRGAGESEKIVVESEPPKLRGAGGSKKEVVEEVVEEIVEEIVEEKILDVGTPTAAYLLGISVGRVRQLLVQKRMRGAFKVRNAWRIPLYDGMPEVIRAPIRNRKGTWQTERRYTKGAMIHVGRHKLAANVGEPYPEPPIIVRRGGKVEKYYHEVEIKGPCKMVYSPFRSLYGARLWIEVAKHVAVEGYIFQAPSSG